MARGRTWVVDNKGERTPYRSFTSLKPAPDEISTLRNARDVVLQMADGRFLRRDDPLHQVAD